MSEQSPNGDYDSRLRVLVVETEAARRDWLVYNLKQQGFDIFVAEGSGQQLMDDARSKVMEHFCQVAVVTPRLFNPADPEDLSGLGLGQLLAPAGIVIFSERADDDVAYRAGLLQMGYFRREHPLRRLYEAVVQQGRQRRMRIEWPRQDLPRHVAETLRIKGERITADHLQDLLGRTFPHASRLVLKLLPGLEPSDLAATPARRAVVLWAQEQQQETNTMLTPKVVKIGTREHIDHEVSNYQNFVAGHLQQERQARLEGHALVWHLGAIAYAFLGASPTDLKPFRQFYTGSEPLQVLDVLRRMFTQTCQTWYQDERRTEKSVRLYDKYNEAMELDVHLQRLDLKNYHLEFDGLPDALPNPALWVIREGRNAVFDQVNVSTSHGDLHADNFFVDQMDMTWLIDFEQTGPAHALRDFVELEADIKLRLAQYPPDDLPALAALERALLTGRTLGAMLVPSREVLRYPGLVKALQVIAGLRHVARLATGATDLQEYYHALLYETLFMATLHGLREAVRRRALLSAALVVERLTTRTGLLQRQVLVPRLDTGLLQNPPSGQAQRTRHEHRRLLQACMQTAEVQARQYAPGELPDELKAGIAEIRQEVERLRAAQDTSAAQQVPEA